MDVAYLPLDPKIRKSASFDQDKLMDWFASVEGSHYSFAKEFFAAIDTPDFSYPAPLNSQAIPVQMRLFEKFFKNEGASKFTHDFNEALK